MTATPNGNDFLETILEKISDLATLTIETIVHDEGGDVSIRSEIDLLDGDIRTEFDPEFIGGPYQELRVAHIERETQGHEIIKANLAALRSMVKLFLDVTQDEKKLAGPSPG